MFDLHCHKVNMIYAFFSIYFFNNCDVYKIVLCKREFCSIVEKCQHIDWVYVEINEKL